jgi:hypothetical protein
MKAKVNIYGSAKVVCRDCRKIEALVREIIEGREDEFIVKCCTLDSPEAEEDGVLMTPAVAMNGEILCIGNVPPKRELAAMIFE